MSGGKEGDSSVSNIDIKEKATSRPRYFLTVASLKSMVEYNSCPGSSSPAYYLRVASGK